MFYEYTYFSVSKLSDESVGSCHADHGQLRDHLPGGFKSLQPSDPADRRRLQQGGHR